MSVFESHDFRQHEQVVFCHDAASGLKAIIAIHSTARGPALGGCRMWAYDDEAAAIRDVLRLSRGMTYKNAIADLPLGGGKSVIIGDARRDKSPALFAAFGRFVDSLGGRYITAEDVGTSVADMEAVAQTTEYVGGILRQEGVKGRDGDPSPFTAYGVFVGLRTAVAHRLGRDTLDGVSVAVQGLGHVGWHLCELLHEAGAALTVTDLRPDIVARAQASFGAAATAPDAILDAAADVFAPCALGAVIDDAAITRLKAPIVAGAANNQLAEAAHGQALADRGVLYAPDYVLNAGGVIEVYHTLHGHDVATSRAHIERIGDTLAEIFRRADASGAATSVIADRLAEERLAHAGRSAPAAAE